MPRGGAQRNVEEMRDAEVPSGHVDLGRNAGILDPAVQNKDFLEVPYSAGRKGNRVVRWESGLEKREPRAGAYNKDGMAEPTENE